MLVTESAALVVDSANDDRVLRPAALRSGTMPGIPHRLAHDQVVVEDRRVEFDRVAVVVRELGMAGGVGDEGGRVRRGRDRTGERVEVVVIGRRHGGGGEDEQPLGH